MGTRARDEDRDRAVDRIEAAYADGQLNAEEREARVTRALGARTLSELTALTRDLQVSGPKPVVVGRPAPQVGKVLLVVALVAAALVLLRVVSKDDSTTPVPAAAVTPTATEEPWRISHTNLVDFKHEMVDKFGTSEVYEVFMMEGSVSIEMPLPGTRKRAERWQWDGEWTLWHEARAMPFEDQMVEFDAVDLKALMKNIKTLERTSDVPQGRLGSVYVKPATDHYRARVMISVTNDFDEVEWMTTTLSGRVLED